MKTIIIDEKNYKKMGIKIEKNIGYIYKGNFYIPDVNLIINLETFGITGSFRCDGDVNSEMIVAKQNITIHKNITTCYLYSKKNINIKGNMYIDNSLGNIYSGKNMIINGNFICNGTLECEGNFKCKGTFALNDSKICKYNFEHKEIIVTEDYQIESIKNHFKIDGYNIFITDQYIKIGCTIMTKKEWAEVTKEEAIKMGDKDLKVWYKRDFLLSQ